MDTSPSLNAPQYYWMKSSDMLSLKAMMAALRESVFGVGGLLWATLSRKPHTARELKRGGTTGATMLMATSPRSGKLRGPPRRVGRRPMRGPRSRLT